ncbi:hypothetical protein [Guptibacillus hwajinpoensis]|uniref:hypothetical protein n=1 Tax=Guptibacillus hwajinpoensis TaxID=208199 RepID=UPI001CFEA1D3|nr:hypothetical protein [Pseudalkalibacillus hwajinpoensis]WLR59203.1 hypothetical protein LC071_18990 [Pseudalkalibacillus hwajinpoensis]
MKGIKSILALLTLVLAVAAFVTGSVTVLAPMLLSLGLFIAVLGVEEQSKKSAVIFLVSALIILTSVYIL